MTQLRTDLSITHLKNGFRTGFDWVLDRFWDGEVADVVEAWSDLVASALDDVILTETPVLDPNQPPFRFIDKHRIKTHLYSSARSGMRGGPSIDLLLQIWFDTEESCCGFGIPLLFRTIPKNGRPPTPMWEELQEDCRWLLKATPCARAVFISEDRGFDWFQRSGLRQPKEGLIAIDANRVAGARNVPLPVFGRSLDDFCLDLASGWIGDSALSGREQSSLLDPMMEMHQVHSILRIRVCRENPERHVEQGRMRF